MSGTRTLSQGAVRRLRSAFGKARISVGQAAISSSPLDLPPGVVVAPEETSELALALRTARAEGIQVVSVGGASRIDGARLKRRVQEGYVLLNTSRLTGIDEINPESLWMSVCAGTGMQDVLRAADGIGCRPVGCEPSEEGTVGGWLSTRAQLPDAILGIPQPSVVCIEAVLSAGDTIRSTQTPRSAVGPDLFSLLLGTQGGFGVITSAVLKLEPTPERRLLTGYRFSSLSRTLDFVASILDGIIPVRRLQVLVDGQPGRRMARVWLTVEGSSILASQAQRGIKAKAERFKGEIRELERVSAWREASVFSRRKPLTTSVRWSRVEDLIRAADRMLGGFPLAVLDRPGLTGCRMRIALPKGARGNPRPGWARLADPERNQATAWKRARAVLEAIRRELDPDGLHNPQAWPMREAGLPR